MEIFLLIVVLIGVFFLSQWGVMLMTRRACATIINDLKRRKAYNPDSAAALPYAQKKGFFHFGTRDYKPQALQHLVQHDIIRMTDDGRFHLTEKVQDVTL